MKEPSVSWSSWLCRRHPPSTQHLEAIAAHDTDANGLVSHVVDDDNSNNTNETTLFDSLASITRDLEAAHKAWQQAQDKEVFLDQRRRVYQTQLDELQARLHMCSTTDKEDTSDTVAHDANDVEHATTAIPISLRMKRLAQVQQLQAALTQVDAIHANVMVQVEVCRRKWLDLQRHYYTMIEPEVRACPEWVLYAAEDEQADTCTDDDIVATLECNDDEIDVNQINSDHDSNDHDEERAMKDSLVV
jgi:hypothetical protein